MARRNRTPIIGVDRGIEYSRGIARRIMGSLVLVGAVLLVITAAIVFVIGRPPRTFTIAAGAQGGAYVAFAEALRDDLAKRGFTVNIIETAGSVDNVGLLRSGAADVGIVQSGTDSFMDMAGLTAISELFYEPVWMFHSQTRLPGMDSADDLLGKRVGIGPEGSGTNLLARAILSAVGVDDSNTTLVPATTGAMLEMLQAGTLDLAFVVASPAAPIVAEYASTPGIAIFDDPFTEAISRRYPFLTSLVLPRGVFGIADGLPPTDVTMVGVRATLLAKDGLQADIVRLLAGSVAGVLPYPLVGDPAAFPGLEGTQFPPNEDAARYFKEGATALEQLLPFEIASPLSRWWVLLLPLLVLMLPLYAVIRAIWSWFNTSRIVSWYPRLHWIEQNLDRFSIEQLDAQLAFLNGLDDSLPTRTHISAGYLAAYYDLRRSLRFVADRVAARRQVLQELEAAGGAPLPSFDEAPPETPGAGRAAHDT